MLQANFGMKIGYHVDILRFRLNTALWNPILKQNGDQEEKNTYHEYHQGGPAELKFNAKHLHLAGSLCTHLDEKQDPNNGQDHTKRHTRVCYWMHGYICSK